MSQSRTKNFNQSDDEHDEHDDLSEYMYSDVGKKAERKNKANLDSTFDQGRD